ncbi:MAG: hypothetical protein H0X03_01685 [Nitrosopumilus sp.]|nr:hypothetical protein [Nitrosopumilus sp.]
MKVSKSYEYKLKSLIKKKISNLLDKELPLLSSLLYNSDLTKISKRLDEYKKTDLTKFSKTSKSTKEDVQSNSISNFKPKLPNTNEKIRL